MTTAITNGSGPIIEIQLSTLPPSANRLWRRSGRRIHINPKYAAWMLQSGKEIMEQRPRKHEGPYKLGIQAVRPDKRKRDLGNLEKACSDLLQKHGIVRDDSDCELITMRWVTVGAGVRLTVEPAGTE